MTTTPTSEIDLFASSDQHVRYEQYRRLRELGGVVRVQEPDAYAVVRYDEVKAALADHGTFISGQGIGFNPVLNQIMQGNTLVSDPPEHDVLRSVVAGGLKPRAIRERTEEVVRKARDLVAQVVEKGAIDGVTEFAQVMPISVIPDFLGLPERNREHLYAWAQGGTDLQGHVTERTPHNLELTQHLVAFTTELAANRELTPGTLGAAVLEAADQGVIPAEKCPILFIDYIGPSLETTATAIGHLLVIFAERPDQWAALRAEPGLVASTINELVRFQSPLRGFSRIASRDTELGGVHIPQGARVWTLIGSANRDERKWERPDEFDFRRNPIDHLAFGYGTHGCAGQGVARLELHALIHALLDAVERFELTGDPVIAENSMANTHTKIPVRFVPRKSA